MTPVELFSTTASHLAMRSFRTRLPSGCLAFAPKPSFERLEDANEGDISPPVASRMKSG